MPGRRTLRRRRRPPWGQHFLKDSRIRAQILELLSAGEEDCWLEIGPGHGEMTIPLARASRALTAVESDPELVAALRSELTEFPAVRVVEADILKFSLDMARQEMPCERLRVYGNLPYYITSPILRRLFDSLASVVDIHVMVQREVAGRLAARPGGRDYGYLSVLTEFHTRPEILQRVPRGAFQPPPQVESALVRLTPVEPDEKPQVGEPDKFMAFVSRCFHQKRKTLRNNLRGQYAAERLEETLAAMALSRRARAEELPLETFVRLFTSLELGGEAGRSLRWG